MKKKIFCLTIVVFLSAALSACKQEEAAGEVINQLYGTESEMEKSEIEFPGQAVGTKDGVYVMNEVRNNGIFYLDSDTGAVTETGREQEGEFFINAAVVSEEEGDDALYASVLSADQETIYFRKLSKENQWETITGVDVAREEWRYLGSGFFVDRDETFYLAAGKHISCISSQGKIVSEYKLDGEACRFLEGENGTIECVMISEEGIVLYELSKTKAKKRWSLSCQSRSIFPIDSSDDTILCFACGDTILFVERMSGRLCAQADCLQSGISLVDCFYGSYDDKEERIRLYGKSKADCLSVVMLKKQEEGEAVQRIPITYGTPSLNPFIQERISEFNKNNKEYYITAKVYGGGSWESINAGAEQIYADIVGGEGPDIIDLHETGSVSYTDYVRNGCLLELSEYLEQSECSDDIFQSVIDTFREDDGALYRLTPHFSVSGMVLAPVYEDFGNDWKVDRFFELLEKNSKTQEAVCNSSAYDILNLLFVGLRNELIDTEKREAYFETEEFVRLLTLCKEYGKENQSREESEAWLFERWELMDKYSYLRYVRTHGREYQICGYPTYNSSAFLVREETDVCGINAMSEYKDGAWEFLKTLLDSSYQENESAGGYSSYLPIRVSAWEKLCESAKQESVRINNSEPLFMTDNEIQIVNQILNQGSLAAVENVDYEIYDILQEESAAYFLGGCTAEETAHVIQSRVEIILNE